MHHELHPLKWNPFTNCGKKTFYLLLDVEFFLISKSDVLINSYESPIGASPSRNLDHSRPYEDELFDRSMSYRGSVGRAIGNATSYNGELIVFFFSCCEFYDLKINN